MYLNAITAGRAWINGNRISSDGNAVEIPILGLPEGALELYGKLVSVDGKFKLNGIFSHDPFQPGKKVTQDGFDQVHLYYSLYTLQDYLFGLGIDTQKILASQHGGKPHPIAAHANAVDDLNAWYSPQSDDLTFGTNGDMTKGEDKWHLASDGDVVTHEGGHLILDHINRKLAGWWTDSRNLTFREPEDEKDDDKLKYGEGRAIHEGFGDLVAAFFYDDPEMSEDFAPNIGKPESKEDGLRNVNNDLTINDTSSEEHDRGKVYGGFFWSIKKQLTDPNGPFRLTNREAADLCMKLLFNHASQYDTSRPRPKDFVGAVIKGAEGLAATGELRVDLQAFKSIIMAEGIKRKMIKQPAEIFMMAGGNAILKSFADVGKKFGVQTSFALEQRTPFYGGLQEIYQQQYRLSGGRVVDVIGGGLFVQKDPLGRVVSISIKDVRPIGQGEINETINIPPGQAMANAYSYAQKQFYAAGNKARGFMSIPRYMLKGGLLTAAKEAQMEFRIAEAAVNHFRTKGLAKTAPRLVIIPGSNALHYEIKVGLGIYYINTQTGELSFKRDVLAN